MDPQATGSVFFPRTTTTVCQRTPELCARHSSSSPYLPKLWAWSRPYFLLEALSGSSICFLLHPGWILFGIFLGQTDPRSKAISMRSTSMFFELNVINLLIRRSPDITPEIYHDWRTQFGKTFRFHGLGRHDYRLMSFDSRVLSHVLTSPMYQKPWQTRAFLGRLLGRGQIHSTYGARRYSWFFYVRRLQYGRR